MIWMGVIKMFRIRYSKLNRMYYIALDGWYRDRYIAKALNLKYEEYGIIMEKYRAIEIGGCYFFQFEENAQRTVNGLESILIMERLIGD